MKSGSKRRIYKKENLDESVLLLSLSPDEEIGDRYCY